MDRGDGEKRYFLGLNRNVFYTGIVSMLMDVSSEMVYPLLPLFLTTVLGATKTAVGIIEGVAETTASILKIFSGWLSDKLGKRKLLMGAGYGISAASRPLIAVATAWSHVLGARFIDRVGKGTRTAPRDAIIADSTDKEKLGLAFGFHRSMDTVGAIIGPGIAFLILLFFVGNLRLVFLLSTIPAVIAVLVIMFLITEKKRTKEEAARLPRFSISDFDGPFRRYLVVVGVFSLGYFADAFVILRAEDLGVSSALIPIIYLAFNVVYALSSTPMGALADRIGLRRMVLAGFLYYSFIFVLIAFAAETLHIWVLFPLYGIYKGMSEGTLRAYLATLAPPERKATAFGVYHTVVGLMLLPASVIAGYLWDTIGPEATFLYGSGMSALAALIFVVFRPGKGR